MNKYFSMNPWDGLELFDSAIEARNSAVSFIAVARKEAAEGGEWDGDMESVFWGEVFESAVEKKYEGGSDFQLEAVQ